MRDRIRRLFERKVSREEVVRCFLEVDFQKDGANYGDLPDRLPDLLKQDWAEIEAELKKYEGYKKSPVGEWTREDKRGKEVRQWVLRKGVPLEECWTARINSGLVDAVNEVSGNLSQLAKSERDEVIGYFGKVEDRNMPNRKNRTLIGLLREKKGEKEGKIQLLDGVHRLVGMSSNGAQKTKMYLGKLKDESHRERGTSDPEPPKPPKHDF